MTDNHGYHTPSQGTENWHEPLNENFEQLDTDVEIRDTADNREEYEPKVGAKFIELDTGKAYIGDGQNWIATLAMPFFEDDGTLNCELFVDCIDTETDNGDNEQDASTFGVNARSVHDGAIVFGDSTQRSIWSEQSDEIRSQMPIYAPSFNTTSASSAKTAVEPIDPIQTLEGVQSLDISTWQFVDGDDSRHMGPMAEDFHDAFDLGGSDESIATVDADGVAFAAIQGLIERLDELESENEVLRSRMNTLEDALGDRETIASAQLQHDD